ncbi:type II toxin-antitoxin system RelE/ParE family toxin [Neisseria weixii]|uniref:type II toxin-antitoxin system RelE/ParE family toxin n=1 Tax=Neisseria weixii TaxID=1853276 RepID=UPI000BB776D1|nr:type II toxin-antitoxin system RelE/ParE family toxin [Neisseria weixii]ATD64625.1 hypothetical protein CGZ65_03585 [Neisseria weixii]
MNINWSERAVEQLDKLLEARKDFAGTVSAQKAFWEIERLLELAATQPKMGKPGTVKDTRELYPLRYRLIYQIDKENVLNVIAILPQWQKWPVDDF